MNLVVQTNAQNSRLASTRGQGKGDCRKKGTYRRRRKNRERWDQRKQGVAGGGGAENERREKEKR